MTTNGLTQAIKGKVNWGIILVIFLVGVTMGWIWTTEQNRCEQLVAEHSRLIGMFEVAAQAAENDGDPATAKVFAAYSNAARNTSVPSC